MHNLELSINPGQWAYFEKRNQDVRFKSFQQRVAEDSNYVCQFCGFKDKNFLQVVNLDGNYKNNKISNLVIACPFCAQCSFLEMIGKVRLTGGTLINMPELSQNDLNGITHALFFAIVNGTEYADYAQNIYNNLKVRSRSIEDIYGKGLSSPSFMGQMIIDTPIKERERLAKKVLYGLRVLPDLKSFSFCVKKWSNTTLKNMLET